MTPSELKALRASAGLTQKQLAELLKISARTVEAWEAGKNPVSPAMTELIQLKIGNRK